MSSGSSEHPYLEYVDVLIVKILPWVPIKTNVFCGSVKLFRNVGPKFESPVTFKDKQVKLFLIVVIPLTFKDEKQVVLFNVVKLETFNYYEHVTALLNVVYPVTYNNVFIETP